MTISTTSARPNAYDRLRSIYASPGPYTSLYMPCGELAMHEPSEVLDAHRDDLARRGASTQALEALSARLQLPLPDDVGGWALHAANDGSTAVDFAPEGPLHPLVHTGELPMAAPLLEWDQWRVPHITVSVDPQMSEVVSFLPGAEPAITPLPADPAAAALALRELAVEEQLRLIMVVDAGGEATALLQALRGAVPPQTNVMELTRSSWSNANDIADATVRYVSDVVARDTVRALEDFRFMTASSSAVEGAAAVFNALAEGSAQSLLIHDDPNAPALASFGPGPQDVSADSARYERTARRVDVAIWSAIQQGVPIRVIPSTGANGPAENIGAVLNAQGHSIQDGA